MKWKKVENVSAETVHVEKATTDETAQYTTALARLRNEKNVSPPCKYFYFNKSITALAATVCQLNNLEDVEILTSPQTRSADSDTFEGLTMEKPLFFWDNFHGKLCKNDDGKVVYVANLECAIVNELEDVEREQSTLYVEIVVIFKSEQLSLKVKKASLFDLKKEILRNFPQCFVYDTNCFQEYIANIYGNFNNKNTVVFYRFGGWYELSSKKHIFLNNALSNVSAKVTLSGTTEEARQFLTLFMQISSEPSKLLMILLYSLWAYTAYFYEICGIDGLRSVLYLSAPTGTGKTSVAKILSSAILNNGEKSVLRFDDTVASLEESLFNSRDILALVDDFYAKGNKFDDQSFKAKASAITRIVGDGMIKGKMGANRKPLPDRKYRGGVIATGEFIDLNTHSSYLRCWIVNLGANSINFSYELSTLQRNSNLARAFFSLWIWWLEKNQDDILRLLKTQQEFYFSVCRKKFIDPYPRFSSNVATFLTINQFFSQFCREYDFSYDTNQAYYAILSEAEAQLQMLRQFSPIKIVIKAIQDSIDNAYLNLAENENDFCTNNYDGFFTSDKIIVITAKLEEIIEKYTNKMNFGLKFTAALKEELARKNILEEKNGETNFKFTKARLVSPKRPRIYKINKGAILNE